MFNFPGEGSWDHFPLVSRAPWAPSSPRSWPWCWRSDRTKGFEGDFSLETSAGRSGCFAAVVFAGCSFLFGFGKGGWMDLDSYGFLAFFGGGELTVYIKRCWWWESCWWIGCKDSVNGCVDVWKWSCEAILQMFFGDGSPLRTQSWTGGMTLSDTENAEVF